MAFKWFSYYNYSLSSLKFEAFLKIFENAEMGKVVMLWKILADLADLKELTLKYSFHILRSKM